MITSKIKKGVIVVALTFLIWTWAYQESEETLSTTATLNVSRAIDKSLLVTFDGYFQQTFEVTLSGSALKIGEFRNKLSKGLEKLEFDFNAEDEGMDRDGKYQLQVLEFLKNSKKIEDLRLTVTFSEVETINVIVKKLVEKQLRRIQCLDEDGGHEPHESITPPSIKAFVPDDWAGQKLVAYVVLHPQDIAKARKEAIQRKPYVVLLPGEHRYDDDSVSIKLPSTETSLLDKNLQGADLRIGYIFSAQTKGKYNIQLINESELISTTTFKATGDAFRAYKEQEYQILIEIHDEDIGKDSVPREAIYNFPQKYIVNNEIKPAGTPRSANFKLVAIPSKTNGK